MKRWFPVLLFLITFASGCGSDDPATAGDGHEYKLALIKTIEAADRIVVTEHSSPYDWEQPNEAAQLPDIVYGTVEVPERARRRFLQNAYDLDETTQTLLPACITVVHHTIRFYRGNQLLSTMKICFKCGQVDWDGSSRLNPWGLIGTLSQFISRAGLTPRRDWKALARQAR